MESDSLCQDLYLMPLQRTCMTDKMPFVAALPAIVAMHAGLDNPSVVPFPEIMFRKKDGSRQNFMDSFNT